MTEQEWLECTDLAGLLRYLNDKISERKFRLTECAFLRRFWSLLTDERNRRAVEVAEKFADGDSTRDDLRGAYADAEAAFDSLLHAYFPDLQPHHSFWGGAVSAAQHTSRSDYDMPELFIGRENPERFRNFVNLQWISTAAFPIGAEISNQAGFDAIWAEQTSQIVILRDIFGNPFRPITLNPEWLAPTVLQLAQAIYDERTFDKMPILADALHDAGCDNEEILGHCRGAGPHVRGCWVVDLLLGKQ